MRRIVEQMLTTNALPKAVTTRYKGPKLAPQCVNPGNDSGKIQKFLGISVDKTFGNETAEAVASYLGYPNITTRQDLFKHMVKDHPNEFKGGIGPNAQKVIGDLLYAQCQKLAKQRVAAEELANYRPSIPRGMWEQIMRLWDNDEQIKNSLLASVNKEIKKQLAQFNYNELQCYAMTFENFIKDVTFKPCMRLKAAITKVELTDIEQASGDWMRASGEFRGEGSAEGYGSSLYGDLDVLLRIKDGNLEVKLDDLDANLGTYFDLLIFEVKFRHNKVKLYNDFWCDGLCNSWSTPLEKEAKKAVGTQKEDIMPWLKKYNLIS